MKLSTYAYLFNATKREFDLDGMVTNFTDFADEVVCATIPSEDDTLERLKGWEAKLGASRFRVVQSTIDITKDNRWDGGLKTAALEACSPSTVEDPRVYVIADADERFVPSNRPKWIQAAEWLMASPYDGYLIPVLDLYQDDRHIRADQTVGVKFRMHKNTVVKRGVIPEAEMGYGGLFRTDMSDSTEPIDRYGHLARFGSVVANPMHLWPQVTDYLNQYPYVLHFGHLDAERRAKLNREFWREHWLNRSGQEPTMEYQAERIREFKLIEHKVALA